MGDFKKLEVWKASHDLALRIYRETAAFPKHELYVLTSQMRRAAISIPSNLAEGCGRGGDTELARFAAISMGSANELEYLLLLSSELGYHEPSDLIRDLASIGRQLRRFRERLRSSGQ